MRARAAAKFLLPLLLLGVAVTGFGYFKSTKPNQPKPRRAERSWTVETLVAQPGLFAPSLTLYGKVEAPTLIFHRREDSVIPLEFGAETAALIPNSRLVTLEGRGHFFLPDDSELARLRTEALEFLDSIYRQVE